MKTCLLCGTEKEDAILVQVIPATWNGFHNYAEVCEPCRNSRRFKTLAKSKTGKTVAPAAPADGAAAENAPAPEAGSQRSAPSVQIAHRRTGVVLHTVESHTLANASLNGAVLSGADLQQAVLRNADLQKADLRLADLTGADLRGADLRGVNLRGADLRGADLRETKMLMADLSQAVYDTATRWPSGFDPIASGARKQPRIG